MGSDRDGGVMEEKGGLMGRKGMGRQTKLNPKFKQRLSRPWVRGIFPDVILLHHSETSHYSH